MKEDIYCRGEWWNVNEYNKRLSNENKINEKYEKLTEELENKEEQELIENWKK